MNGVKSRCDKEGPLAAFILNDAQKELNKGNASLAEDVIKNSENLISICCGLRILSLGTWVTAKYNYYFPLG